jgi:hypothetical protein
MIIVPTSSSAEILGFANDMSDRESLIAFNESGEPLERFARPSELVRGLYPALPAWDATDRRVAVRGVRPGCGLGGRRAPGAPGFLPA